MSGNILIRKIDTYVDQADQAKRDIERNLHRVQSELEAIDRSRFSLMEQIASVQVDSILGGENVRDVTGNIRQAMDRREANFRDLEAQMDDLRERLKQTQLEVDTHRSTVATKNKSFELDKTSDPEVKALQAQLAILNKEIQRLTDIFDQSRDECRSKLVAFDKNPAFQHLMQRKFGTDGYKGMGFFVLLDKWLAEKIDFVQSMHDYNILQKLPVMAETKLDESVSNFKSVSQQIEALTFKINQKHGLHDAQGRLSKAEERLKQRQQELSGIQNDINEHLAMTDPAMVSIRKSMQQSLSKLSIPTLERMTKATKSLRDEQALESYKELSDRESRLKLQEQTLQVRLRETGDTFRRTKELRDHFKSRDYDNSNRTYRDSFDLSSLVVGFMTGRLSSSDVDSIVRTQSSVRQPREEETFTYSDSFGGLGSRSGGSDGFKTSDSLGDGDTFRTTDSL